MRPTLTNTLGPLKISLDGLQNQDFRLLLRWCGMSFVAIGESGIPVLEELLPVAEHSHQTLIALLLLANRLRSNIPDPLNTAAQIPDGKSNLPQSSMTTAMYQDTLTRLRSKIPQMQAGDTDGHQTQEILATTLILSFFGFPEQTRNWSPHVTGLISLIEQVGVDSLAKTSLGKFVTVLAAHFDIPAFSVGRLHRAHGAWLKWDMQPPTEESFLGRTELGLSSLEITLGYPESLITIISVLSTALQHENSGNTIPASLQELIDRLFSFVPADDAKSFTTTPQGSNVDMVDDNEDEKIRFGGHVNTPSIKAESINWQVKMESVIRSWRSPILPSRLSMPLGISLVTAWEVMRKAALIYLWRLGFEGNVNAPMRADRAAEVIIYIREIIQEIQALMGLVETQGNRIANAMIWPAVVVGNELGGEPVALQEECLGLFHQASEHFRTEHVEHVENLLKGLWFRHKINSATGADEVISLELLSKELEVCIPLF